LRLGAARFLPHPFRFIIHVTRTILSCGPPYCSNCSEPCSCLPACQSVLLVPATHQMCDVLGVPSRGPAVERLHVCFISDVHREADENCALLRHYAVSSGNFLPTVWDNLSVPSSSVQTQSLTTEDGTDRLSRNVGKILPLLAAL